MADGADGLGRKKNKTGKVRPNRKKLTVQLSNFWREGGGPTDWGCKKKKKKNCKKISKRPTR